MLWIYGGGFQSGVSSVYTANELIAQSVRRVRSHGGRATLLFVLSVWVRKRLSSTSASTTAPGHSGSHKERKPRSVVR